MLTTNQNTYREDIDGLRGIAIILVVLFHLFPDYIPNGYLGVDIFFVISGYLITGSILKKINTNDFTWKGFIGKRIKRIIPALFFIFLLFQLIALFILSPNELVQFSKDIFKAMFFSTNYFLQNEIGYFTNESITKPFLHLWSFIKNGFNS